MEKTVEIKGVDFEALVDLQIASSGDALFLVTHIFE